MIDPLRKLEIKQYTEAVIFAFEFKKQIRSFCFKGKNEVRFFAQCIDDIITKSAYMVSLIEEERQNRAEVERIFNSIVLQF